MEPER